MSHIAFVLGRQSLFAASSVALMLSRSVAQEENSHKGRDTVKYYGLYFKEFVLGTRPLVPS